MIFQLSSLARKLYDIVERQGTLGLMTSPAPDSGTVVTTASPPRLDPKLLELARVENYIDKSGKRNKFLSLFHVFV